MKKYILFVLMIAPALILAMNIPSAAVEKIIIGRTVYIPLYHIELNPEYRVGGGTATLAETSYDFTGFGFRGEYNQRYGKFCVGAGLEWNYMLGIGNSKGIHLHYLIPDGTFKIFFFKDINFYVGVGLAGRILVNKAQLGEIDYDRQADLWARFIAGYYHELIKNILVGLEFDYDSVITYSQWSTGKRSSDGASANVMPDYVYDVKLSIGLGIRLDFNRQDRK